MSNFNVLYYKGYYTKIDFSAYDKTLYGELEGITDFVDFMSDNVDGIVKEFHSAVDDYIEFCNEHGKIPEKPDSLPPYDDYDPAELDSKPENNQVKAAV